MTYVPRASLHGVDLSGPTALIPSKGPIGSLWLDETTNAVWMQTTSGMACIGQASKGVPPGTVWYVDSVNGSNSNGGHSWAAPKLTIAAAVAACSAGDTILIKGAFTEAVTLNKASVKIIGAGATPKDAIWTSATDTNTLTITAAYCRVANIYFKPPAYTAVRDIAAIKLSGAHWCQIVGSRFQGQTGSQNAIYDAAQDSDNVTIADNEFMYMNTSTYGTAIKGVEGSAGFSAWSIVGNTFSGCVVDIDIGLRNSLIQGNKFPAAGINAAGAVATVTTTFMDISGTAACGANMVVGNFFGGTYSNVGGYTGSASDLWAGNYAVGGLTSAAPA